MRDLCLLSTILPACLHDNVSNFQEWLSKLRDHSTLKIRADAVDDASTVNLPKASASHFAMNLTMLHGSFESQPGGPADMVFVAHKEHLATSRMVYIACYYTSPGPAARWLQLCTLYWANTWGKVYIRSDKTCYACTLEPSRLEQPDPGRREKYSLLL